MVSKNATLLTKKSTTASAVPPAGSLQPGELAINLVDRKLYSKDAAGVVFQVSPPASALGVGVGNIDWRAFQTRLLVTKDHAAGEAQALLDIQVNTRSGTIDGGGGTGSAMSVTSRATSATKYGQFNFVSLLENFSTYAEGVDPFFGHVSLIGYVNQYAQNSASAWGCALQVQESHGLPNPINGELALEATIVARGPDTYNKRTIIFLPTNKLGLGSIAENTNTTNAYNLTAEFFAGIYWKTAPGTLYKNAMYLEGNYTSILSTKSVNSVFGVSLDGTFTHGYYSSGTYQSLMFAAGSYSRPILDFHTATVPGGIGVALNDANRLGWQNGSGVTQESLGYDTANGRLASTRSGSGTIALINSWVAYAGAGQSAPQYRRGIDGIVTLRGAANGGVLNSIIGNLPAGYRPAAAIIVPTFGAFGLSALKIYANGDIQAVGVSDESGAKHVCFDGVSFSI